MEDKVTQDIIDQLYGRVCRARKNSKTYWEALSDMHYAQSKKHLQELEELKKLVADSDAGKALELVDELRKENGHLKAQLEDYDKDTAEQIQDADEQREEAQNELKMLLDAFGISAMDWERALAIGHINGRFLT